VSDENRGEDVRADGLVEVFGEGFAIDVGAEIFGVRDGTEGGREAIAKGAGGVLPTLVGVDGLRDGGGARCGGDGDGRAEAAILQSGEMSIEEIVPKAAISEGGILRESAQRVIHEAHGEIGGAAEDEVSLVSDREALGAGVGAGGGVAEGGDEDTGLARAAIDRVGDVGEKEDRDAKQLEGGVGGAGVLGVEGELVAQIQSGCGRRQEVTEP